MKSLLVISLSALSILAVGVDALRLNFDCQHSKAMACAYRSDWKEVLSLSSAIRQAPFRPDLLFARGLAYQGLGRFENAEKEYRACLRLSPNAWYAHYNLAYVLRNKDIDEAAQHLAISKSLCPDAFREKP